MGKQCSTVYMSSLFFIPAVLVSAAIANQCQVILLERCKAVYEEVLSASYQGKLDHCSRLQRMVTCLASESSCQGELVEKFRYWMLQMATMDNILGVCKNIQYSSLKSVVQESDVAKARRYLDDVENDEFDECAVSVHKQCVRYYITVLMKDGQICKDAEKLNECYDLSADV